MGVALLRYSKSLRGFEVNITVAVVSQSHTFKSLHFQIRTSRAKRMVLRNIVEVDEEKTNVSTSWAKNVKEVRRLEKSVFKERW